MFEDIKNIKDELIAFFDPESEQKSTIIFELDPYTDKEKNKILEMFDRHHKSGDITGARFENNEIKPFINRNGHIMAPNAISLSLIQPPKTKDFYNWILFEIWITDDKIKTLSNYNKAKVLKSYIRMISEESGMDNLSSVHINIIFKDISDKKRNDILSLFDSDIKISDDIMKGLRFETKLGLYPINYRYEKCEFGYNLLSMPRITDIIEILDNNND